MKLTLVSISKKYFTVGENVTISAKVTMGSSETTSGELNFAIGNVADADDTEHMLMRAWIVKTYTGVKLAKGASKTYTFEFTAQQMKAYAQGEATFSMALDVSADYSGGFRTALVKNVSTYIVERADPVILSAGFSDAHTLNPLDHFGAFIQGRSIPRLTATYALDAQDPDLTATHDLTLTLPDGSQQTFTPVDDVCTLPELSDTGQYDWTYTITDSAEHSAARSGSFTVLAYSPPTLDVLNIERYAAGVDDEGRPIYSPADDGESLWYTIDATVAAVAGKNGWQITRLRDDTSATRTLLSGADGTHIARINDRALDTDAYSPLNNIGVHVLLSDFFETVERMITIPKAGGWLNIEKHGVAVGQRSNGTLEDKRFEVAPDYRSLFYGGIEGVTNFAEGEVPTGGHWIDGRPIFRFMWVGTTSLSNKQGVACSLPVTPDIMLTLRAMVEGSGGWRPIPNNYYGGSTWNCNIYNSGANISLGFGSSWKNSRRVIIMAEYVKA